jgi:hypothetical protein
MTTGLSTLTQFPNLFLTEQEVEARGLVKPSDWVMVLKPLAEGGNPNGYGLRRAGGYVVDVDNDAIESLGEGHQDIRNLGKMSVNGSSLDTVLDDPVSERIPLTAIMSSGSPGGLLSKKSSGLSGKIVVLEANTDNIDIAMGNPARAVYPIGAPTVSIGTTVRTSLVLLNDEQMKAMDASEFIAGNYTVVAYEPGHNEDNESPGAAVTLRDRDGNKISTIRTLGYEGLEAAFKTRAGESLVFGGVPAENRKLRPATMAEYFELLGHDLELFAEGMEVEGKVFHPKNGSEFFSQLRGMYEGNAEAKGLALAFVNTIKAKMKDLGLIVDQTLAPLGLRTVHDPYVRDDNNAVVRVDGKAQINEYTPTDRYGALRLSAQKL